ncbi:MAG: T9SS type A sorting domain-containing protein [Phaeodactylibacter sp.]|nr:T9SS type A sorting domain-containing protein [Phaeodactylibacter sp.]
MGSFPLDITPNPANDQVIINSSVLTNTEKIKIALFNQLGVLCEINELQIGNSYLRLNLGNIPAGIYFLHLTVGNRFSVGRIIKQ